VSIDSLHAFRDSRKSAAQPPRVHRRLKTGGEDAAGKYRLGRAETRAELTERAESTVREERDRLLEEVERLRGELDEARRPWWRRLFE
jgi:hypothetical protein